MRQTSPGHVRRSLGEETKWRPLEQNTALALSLSLSVARAWLFFSPVRDYAFLLRPRTSKSAVFCLLISNKYPRVGLYSLENLLVHRSQVVSPPRSGNVFFYVTCCSVSWRVPLTYPSASLKPVHRLDAVLIRYGEELLCCRFPTCILNKMLRFGSVKCVWK